MRFVNRCRHGIKQPQSALSVTELENTRNTWLRYIQEVDYPDELQALQKRTKNKLVDDLALFRDDDNLIRCKGRLEHSSLQYSAKYPVLLPRGSPVTRAIVNDSHKEVLHGSVAHTYHEEDKQSSQLCRIAPCVNASMAGRMPYRRWQPSHEREFVSRKPSHM